MFLENKYKAIITFLFAGLCGNFAEAATSVIEDDMTTGQSNLKKKQTSQKPIPDGITPKEWEHMQKANEKVGRDLGQTESRRREKNH